MIHTTKNKEDGFVKLIIVIVIALLLMRHFNLTIGGIMDYFHLTASDISTAFKKSLDWFKDLFNSVK